MNERIKELAEQLRYGKERWNSTQEFENFLEKFAELIVQECIEQVYPQWIKDHPLVDPTDLADAVSRVKEHFGVE